MSEYDLGDTPASHRLRREFYSTVLSEPATRPEVDFSRLARAWRAVTESDWVWLWLHNSVADENQWEIREIDCASGDRQAFLPPALTVPANNAVVEYCHRTQRPEFIADIKGWTKTIGANRYTVACQDALIAMGCQSFLSIPFATPRVQGHNPQQRLEPLQGVICAHYRTTQAPTRQPDESLRLMGLLTGSMIVHSYHTAQQEILIDLNKLAHKYLTATTRRPATTRREYLSEVIDLIRQKLHVRSVSIFFEDDRFVGQVCCLATTGIARLPEMELISESWWSDIVYVAGVGLTGECFRSATPIVLGAEQTRLHKPRYAEVLGDEITGTRDVILYPIPAPDLPAGSSSFGIRAKARGVIRCCDHRTPLAGDHASPFDPVDVATLDFIAQQIAPVIETLSVRIQREETISIVKHDLRAPLGMIRDTADEIAEGANPQSGQKRVKVMLVDLLNLRTAALVGLTLAAQLDPEPGDFQDFTTELTLLEGGIVARIKHMLQHFAQRENGMTIRFDGFRDVPALYVNQQLIERVFVNLLMNAVKYGTPGSEIEVKALALRDEYRVLISNYGIGIRPDEATRIFEAGYRGVQAQKKRGLGLGLHIARSAMQRHGGELALIQHDNPTTFAVIFPNRLRWSPE